MAPLSVRRGTLTRMCGQVRGERESRGPRRGARGRGRRVRRPLEPDCNVAPTQDVPPSWSARRARDARGPPVRQLRVLTWGLVPYWAKDASIGNRMINARAETRAREAGVQAGAPRGAACVPADGWYEWQVPGRPTPREARKQPFFMHRADGGVLAFAGLYEFWRDPAMPRTTTRTPWLTTFTIITTDAEPGLDRIHDRMPLVLERDRLGRAGSTPRTTDAGRRCAGCWRPRRPAGSTPTRSATRRQQHPQQRARSWSSPLPAGRARGVVDPMTGEVVGAGDGRCAGGCARGRGGRRPRLGPARVARPPTARAPAARWCSATAPAAASRPPTSVAVAAAAVAGGWAVVLVEQPWRVAGRRVAPAPAAAGRGLAAGARRPRPARRRLPRAAGRRGPQRRGPGRLPHGRRGSAPPRVLCLAFPLHPPGRPETVAAPPSWRRRGGRPLLVVQGERDAFGGAGRAARRAAGAGRLVAGAGRATRPARGAPPPWPRRRPSSTAGRRVGGCRRDDMRRGRRCPPGRDDRTLVEGRTPCSLLAAPVGGRDGAADGRRGGSRRVPATGPAR